MVTTAACRKPLPGVMADREPNGIVDPDEYHRICDEIEEKIHALRETRPDIPPVTEIVRPRQDPLAPHPRHPDVDPVVV